MSFNIENLTYPTEALFLAPMEDITDKSFRHICKENGADMLYTEFVASEALIRNIPKSFKKLEIEDVERPVGIQLYGHNIDAMVEAAKIAQEYKPDLIDINFGCPVKKIANRGAGSGMLRDIPKLLDMTKQIVNAVNLPVTVKTRLGWDSESIIIEDLALKLQDVGIKALAIHGRTRAQLYTGISDWTAIGNIAKNPQIKIPIIGNGDVKTPQDARTNFHKYGVSAIMIGRASIGKPWIFKQMKHYLQTGEILPEPNVSERVEISKSHFKKSLEIKGEVVGIYEMRRHFSMYFKGLPNFKETRLKLLTSKEPQEIVEILESLKVLYAGYDFE